jgi:hypothetical protein
VAFPARIERFLGRSADGFTQADEFYQKLLKDDVGIRHLWILSHYASVRAASGSHQENRPLTSHYLRATIAEVGKSSSDITMTPPEDDSDVDDFDDLGPPSPAPPSRAWRVIPIVFMVLLSLAVLIVLAVVYSQVAELRMKLKG